MAPPPTASDLGVQRTDDRRGLVRRRGVGDAALPEDVVQHLRSIAGSEVRKLAQKLGQLQRFIAVFPQECMGQLASFVEGWGAGR